MGTGTSDVTIHETALVDPSASLGAGTVVWAHAVILAGASLGEGCRVGQAAFIDRDVRIGDRVVIHNKASIYRPVEIGHDVFIGPHVVFVNDPEPRSDLTRDLAGVSWKIHDGATIGANATILSDVPIAAHSFIGAGAVVSRATVPYGIYAGVPARLRGYRCACQARYPETPGLPKECATCHRSF